jgi:hypothetical protein
MGAESNTGAGVKVLERYKWQKNLKIKRGKNFCLFLFSGMVKVNYCSDTKRG